MVTPLQIYLITRCDAIKMGLMVLMLLCVAAFVASILTCLKDYGDEFDHEKWKSSNKRYAKTCAGAFLAFLTLMVSIPTTKEALAILSIPAIANSEMVRMEIPQAIRQLWEKYVVAQEKEKDND